MHASKTTYKLFQPDLIKRLGIKARVCVVLGDVEGLLAIVKNKPEAFFDIAPITDLRERNFYAGISAHQLVRFYCDKRHEGPNCAVHS